MQTVFEKETGRVIVTYGRSMMALVIAHSLGRRGIEVIGCDDVELTVLNFSRYVKNNFVHIPQDPDPEAFVNDLAKKCERYVPDDGKPFVLMPVFRETEVLAKHKHLFQRL